MPITTLTIRYSKESRKAADDLGGFAGNPNRDEVGVNDEYDAYRHALNSAKFADRFGPGVSKFLGDRLEASHPNDDARDTNMDKWNNNVGREEWARWKEAKDQGLTNDSLEKWIRR
jgi:hypothetical protein